MTTPQQTLTGNISTLVDYYKNLLEQNKEQLGIKDVYWGDQTKIPHTPSVCIEPSTKTNNMMGGARRVFNPDISVIVLVYDAAVGSVQRNARDVLILAEAIETLIHTHPQAEGLTINSYVESIDSGYAEKGTTVMRAARLVVQSKSQFIATPS